MPEGGELLVKTSHFDSVLRIEIMDSGMGISEENLKKIYDPFFTTKELGRGTGPWTFGELWDHSGTFRKNHRGFDSWERDSFRP